MYVPEKFVVDDSEEIFSFIEANAFGQIVSILDDRPYATHIPFLVSEDCSHLLGHFARQNPHWNSIEDQQVLIMFAGPHDYISPSWYQNAGVPTWNYQAVHLYGKCRVFEDTEELAGVVDSLSRKFEAQFENPWKPSYRDAMLKGIVGIEIEISEIQCKYKLSQNRPAEDQAGVIENLEKTGSTSLLQAMKKYYL